MIHSYISQTEGSGSNSKKGQLLNEKKNTSRIQNLAHTDSKEFQQAYWVRMCSQRLASIHKNALVVFTLIRTVHWRTTHTNTWQWVNNIFYGQNISMWTPDYLTQTVGCSCGVHLSSGNAISRLGSLVLLSRSRPVHGKAPCRHVHTLLQTRGNLESTYWHGRKPENLHYWITFPQSIIFPMWFNYALVVTKNTLCEIVVWLHLFLFARGTSWTLPLPRLVTSC